MVVLPEVDSTSHKSCTASARAVARKILRRKHFPKPKKNNCATSAIASVTFQKA